MSFPSATPSYAGFTSSHTLSRDTHASQHNSEQADIIALANKVGTGASTPTSGLLLRGNGTGTSTWDTVHLTSDVQGVLGTGNGGTGQASLTSLPLVSPVITGGGSWSGAPIFSDNAQFTGQPIVTNFVSMQHDHSGNNKGGQLNGANAIIAGTITPAGLTAGTGAVWSLASYTPTVTASSGTFTSVSGSTRYLQIGKFVFYQTTITITTAGTAAGYALVTLPITTSLNSGVGGTALGFGREGAISGFTLNVVADSTTGARVYKYDNTTPIASGNILYFSGFYEAA